MDIAQIVAKRSTCFRLNVGAVLVVKNRIVSIGYNGAPSGASHCAGNDCAGITPGHCPTIHAEVNAITHWCKYRVSDDDGEDAVLYVTEAPCVVCAGFITRWPIKRVVFGRPYRSNDGIKLLLGKNIDVHQITPAGYVVDQSTGLVLPPDA